VATVVVASVAGIALAGGSAFAGGAVALGLQPDRTAAVVTPSGQAPATVDTSSLAGVAASVLPSVVSVTAGPSLGSGVVISADGAILTNNHVISSTSRRATSALTVTFADGRKAPATVVGQDATTDLAVIKVTGVSNPSGAATAGQLALTPLPFGDSSALRVGDPVLAVGSPLGLEGSVTAGIVSALNRTIDEDGGTSIGGAIQTDAAINPGNSGGALVNASGELVGINTAIASTSQTSGSIGLGFAIPANTAKRVVEKLLG
jgi:putative serine protease PepD